MDRKTVLEAVKEARKFLDRANDLLNDKGFDPKERFLENGFFLSDPTMKTAALKRTSMDLTRALANVRRR